MKDVMWVGSFAAILSLSACAGGWDNADPMEPAPAERVSLPAPEDDSRADNVGSRHVVELQTPSTNCTEKPLISHAKLSNTTAGEAVITETFGADGCIDERWVRDWDGRLKLSERYDFFDPLLSHFAYVVPAAYVHSYGYDELGRLVDQSRAAQDGAAPFFTESTTYDSAGRVVELTRVSDPMQTSFQSTHREVWEYADSGEFIRHEIYNDAELVSFERRIIDADGQVIEVQYAESNETARRILLNSYDSAGRLVAVETWDRYTAAPESRITLERRPDGTLSRKTSKNLQLGWWDVYEYDSEEREVLYTQDETEDGDIEYRRITRYDARGNVIFASTEYDFDAPTTRYAETVSAYDAQDRLIEWVDTPVWMDGESRRVLNQYDQQSGRISTIDVIDAAGELVRHVEVAEWMDEARLRWRRVDNDRDGELESLEMHRWAGSRPLERMVDSDGDGYVNSIWQWHYDQVGQLAESLVDHDGDRVADERVLYER